MRKILLGITVFLFLVSIGYCQDQPLRLTIKSDKQVYEVGDKIEILVTLRNISDSSIAVLNPQAFGGTSLVINGPNGPCAFVGPLEKYVSMEERVKVLASGALVNYRIALFAGRKLDYDLSSIGRYEIQYKYIVNDGSNWQGALTSNTITIEMEKSKSDNPVTFNMDLKYNYDEKHHWWTFKVNQNEFNLKIPCGLPQGRSWCSMSA